MELGLHVMNFTWPGGPEQIRPTLARVARTAEQAGISRITVMDHVWQIGVVGPPENDMLEAYTALGFLAAHTERVQLHTLVTAAVYREPGLLAKAVTTLDVLSGGRAWLGIGAAWNVEEAEGLGLPFPPTAERFERLEETLQICLQMWSGSEEAYDGTHYTLRRTLSSPQPLSSPRPKIMVGGSGERKTLRLVAKYADACNLFNSPELPHKLDVLRAHCEREGRSYDEIEKTAPMHFEPDTDPAVLIDQLRTLHESGFTTVYLPLRATTDPGPLIDMIGEHLVPAVGGW